MAANNFLKLAYEAGVQQAIKEASEEAPLSDGPAFHPRYRGRIILPTGDNTGRIWTTRDPDDHAWDPFGVRGGVSD